MGQIFSLSNEVRLSLAKGALCLTWADEAGVIHGQELESAAEAHSKNAESGKEEDTGVAEQVRVRLEEDLNNACSIACGSAHVAVATGELPAPLSLSLHL